MITKQKKLPEMSLYAIPGIKRRPKLTTPSPDNIIRVVGEVTGLTHEEITGLSQLSKIMQARKLSMYFIRRKHQNLSLARIGRLFQGKNGNPKNHATVLFACKQVENHLYTDMDFANMFDQISVKINSYEG